MVTKDIKSVLPDAWKYADPKDVDEIKSMFRTLNDRLTRQKTSKHPGVVVGLFGFIEIVMAASYQVMKSGLMGKEAKSAFAGLINDPALLNEDYTDLEFPVDKDELELVSKVVNRW